MTGAITLNLNRNSALDKLQSGFNGSNTLTITGTGFGTGPTEQIYQDWQGKTVGARAPKGVWDSGLYEATASSAYPTYQQLGNTVGIASHDPGDTTLKGFIKKVAGGYTDFFMFWKMGVPDGYYFSGASTGRTLPPHSNLKMGWHSKGPLDDPILEDIVGLSRNSTNNWALVGNQTPVNLNNGSDFDWNKPNTFMAYHKAGANVWTDNGTARSLVCTSAGTNLVTASPAPLFRKLFGITPIVAASTTYTVNVNGTPISYISGSGSPTFTSVCQGIVSQINGAGTNLVASILDTNSDGVAEKVVLTANMGANPNVTLGANFQTLEVSAGQLDQLSTYWQGNDNQVGTMHVFPIFYFATGPNCGNQIAIGNASTLAACTDFDFGKLTAYSGTSIQARFSDPQKVGKTHWYRFFDGQPVDSGVISWS